MNFYQRHIGDYLKDTAHLSLLEHGIYTRLLDVYYTRESGIPDDQAARLIGARGGEIKAVKDVLSEFFTLTDGVWVQARCEAEIAKYKDKTDQAKQAAALSVAARQRKASVERPLNDRSASVETADEPTFNVPRYQIPDTNKQTETKADKRPRFVKPELAEVEAYCLERKNHVNPQDFINHYEANGWKRGKTPVADWKACVRTWEGNDKQPDITRGAK